MSQSWNSKKDCRSFYNSLCAQEFGRGLVQKQLQLNQHLRDFFKARSGLWGAYRALPQEAQVEEVFQISNLSWVFPRMIEGRLEFFEAQGFIEGPYKVLEPSMNSPKRELQEIQGLLVPGLVFNKNGRRLGKGKGFYDKTAAHYQGLKVGICFEFQISSSPLPIESHDIVMDFLITENGLYDCKKY